MNQPTRRERSRAGFTRPEDLTPGAALTGIVPGGAGTGGSPRRGTASGHRGDAGVGSLAVRTSDYASRAAMCTWNARGGSGAPRG